MVLLWEMSSAVPHSHCCGLDIGRYICQLDIAFGNFRALVKLSLRGRALLLYSRKRNGFLDAFASPKYALQMRQNFSALVCSAEGNTPPTDKISFGFPDLPPGHSASASRTESLLIKISDLRNRFAMHACCFCGQSLLRTPILWQVRLLLPSAFIHVSFRRRDDLHLHHLLSLVFSLRFVQSLFIAHLNIRLPFR